MIEIEDIKRLRLEPGDTLVLRVTEGTTKAEAISLRDWMHEAFPDHRAIVLIGSADLTVLSAQEA